MFVSGASSRAELSQKAWNTLFQNRTFPGEKIPSPTLLGWSAGLSRVVRLGLKGFPVPSPGFRRRAEGDPINGL